MKSIDYYLRQVAQNLRQQNDYVMHFFSNLQRYAKISDVERVVFEIDVEDHQAVIAYELQNRYGQELFDPLSTQYVGQCTMYTFQLFDKPFDLPTYTYLYERCNIEKDIEEMIVSFLKERIQDFKTLPQVVVIFHHNLWPQIIGEKVV